MNKPYSQACENNKEPILHKIEDIFLESTTVWEIGSGTGQHACYFARNLPHLQWQATDLVSNLNGINSWIEASGLENLAQSLALNVSDKQWPGQEIEALFSANTLHIMSWAEVECFFSGMGQYLTQDARVCIYGPFNYHGAYTSPSNESFDQWLKSRDSKSGVRDFEAIEKLAKLVGLSVKDDFAMPANNRLLVLQRS
jgi:cyclopropane fatty-acyl-phospholipid synthase-like methyltransferase